MIARPKFQLENEYAAPITFEAWLALPPTHEKVELLNGELVVSPLAYRRHQKIQFELSGQFYLLQRQMPDMEVYAGTNVRASDVDGLIPDLVAFTGRAGGELTDYGIKGPPDLVVEILSPSNRSYDLVNKAAEYARLGVPEYWIIDPDKSILILGRLEGGTYQRAFYTEGIVRCEALDGAEIDLSFLNE